MQRQTLGSFSSGSWAYDTAVYEAYGAPKSDYGAFSSQPNHSPAHTDPVGFGGQWGNYTDTETGLLYLTHRYYDPGTGRFINRDPIDYAGGVNLYGYAGNNPVNESDPSGFDPNKAAETEEQREEEGKDDAVDPETATQQNQPTYQGVPAAGNDTGRPYFAPPRSGEGGADGPSPAEELLIKVGDGIAWVRARFSRPERPVEAFNRDYHYGRTPNAAQKTSVPKGMLFDHDPPLVKHYYEGDGKGGLPGYKMTQAERRAYAVSLSSGRAAIPGQRFGQGGTMRGYGVRMRKQYNLPPFRLSGRDQRTP